MNKEQIWFILPIASFLWMWGGGDFMFLKAWKGARRFLIPLLVFASATYWLGFHWLWLLMGVSFFGVFCLPHTLIGDGLHEHPMNYPWNFIKGLLIGLSSIYIAFHTGLWWEWGILILVPILTFGVLTLLSNTYDTAKYFPWKLCEAMFGASAVFPVCMLIELA